MGAVAVLRCAVPLLFLAASAAAATFEAPPLLDFWGHHGTEPGAFSSVMAIAVGPDRCVYAADDQNRIERFSAEGEFQLQWGSRGAADGQFQTPAGIAVSAAGEVFVVEFRGERVQVFDRDGHFLRKWGTHGSGPGQFTGPEKIALDRHGDVYVTDTGNCRVEKFSVSGQFRAAWGRRGAGQGEFTLPVGIAVGADDRIYVADLTAGGVQVFSSGGRFLSAWPVGPGTVPPLQGIPSLKRGKAGQPTAWMAPIPRLTEKMADSLCVSSLHKPAEIGVDRAGDVLVLDETCDRVQRYRPDGQFVGGWYVTGRPAFMMGQATGLTLGANGDVYVARMNVPEIRRFGSGPSRAERVATESLGWEGLQLVDSLLALPLGTAGAGRPSVAAGAIRLAWEHLGFNGRPTLASAVWDVDVPGATDARSLRAALADVAGRRLGAPRAPVDATPADTSIFENAGTIFRTRVIRRAGGATGIRVERGDAGAEGSAQHPDTCDLRLLEGGLTEPAGSWSMLLPGLRARHPELAAAMLAGTATEASLLEVVRRAVGPGVPEADRDLVLLSADQWLRSSGTSGHFAALGHDLGPEWNRIGFRTSGEGTYWVYYGSILDSLVTRVGRDEWADRAFLILLDQGWVSDGSGDYEDAEFGNDIFAPVLKRGEAFLATHPDAALWPSVALRVALAHETLWSLSHHSTPGDYPDWTVGAQDHRKRALQLYRELTHRTRDARLQQALERKVRSLERGEDTNCRAYYIEGED